MVSLRHAVLLGLTTLSLAAAALPAQARADDAAEQRLRDALRQTTLQLRQLQDQNAELQTKQQALEQQLAAAPKQASAAEAGQAAGLRRSLAGKSAEADALRQQLDEARKSLAEWQQARQQAVDFARKRDADATRYQSQFEDSEGHLHSCEQKNAALYALGSELLERYKNKGMWEAAKNDEPFLQLHRVRLEELAQGYHDKLVDQKVVPKAGVAQGQ